MLGCGFIFSASGITDTHSELFYPVNCYFQMQESHHGFPSHLSTLSPKDLLLRNAFWPLHAFLPCVAMCIYPSSWTCLLTDRQLLQEHPLATYIEICSLYMGLKCGQHYLEVLTAATSFFWTAPQHSTLFQSILISFSILLQKTKQASSG